MDGNGLLTLTLILTLTLANPSHEPLTLTLTNPEPHQVDDNGGTEAYLAPERLDGGSLLEYAYYGHDKYSQPKYSHSE